MTCNVYPVQTTICDFDRGPDPWPLDPDPGPCSSCTLIFTTVLNEMKPHTRKRRAHEDAIRILAILLMVVLLCRLYQPIALPPASFDQNSTMLFQHADIACVGSIDQSGLIYESSAVTSQNSIVLGAGASAARAGCTTRSSALTS